jgi:hypothetical protein
MFALLLLVALTIPPAAKVLAVTAVVYATIQALKKVPTLAPYLKGWVAVAVNILFSASGLIITIPAAQLYTQETLLTLITTVLTAAGIHGTVQNLSTQN